MIITGTNGNYRVNKLARKVADLILSGVSSDKIDNIDNERIETDRSLIPEKEFLRLKAIIGKSEEIQDLQKEIEKIPVFLFLLFLFFHVF